MTKFVRVFKIFLDQLIQLIMWPYIHTVNYNNKTNYLLLLEFIYDVNKYFRIQLSCFSVIVPYVTLKYFLVHSLSLQSTSV